MVKQTNAEHTLGRSKGKYKGDEDSLKSSTDKPRKELSINLSEEEINYLRDLMFEDYIMFISPNFKNINDPIKIIWHNIMQKLNSH